MSDSVISVVMPVFNNEKYVSMAARSVLRQTFDDVELVIIDDGSTDDTAHIVDKIAHRDSRVKVIHQENQWIYASMNNGIAAANGEYIYILNSDDVLFENSLSNLVKVIERYNHPDVIWTGILDMYCDEILNVYKSVEARRFPEKEIYCDNIEVNSEIIIELERNNFFRDQANVYKREIMLQHPFRNDFYGADTYFNYEIAETIKNCVVLNENFYGHYIFDDVNMNVANKKYMGYEHYMFNELFFKAMELLKVRGISNQKNTDFFVKKRKQEFSIEIHKLLNDKNYKDVISRLDEVFQIPYDDAMKMCFGEDKEEFEARILAELRKFYINSGVINHFSYTLLEELLHYEHSKKDIETIAKCVFSEENPSNIGISFYNKLYR